MRVPRSLLEVLVFAASTAVVYGQSATADDEPKLGTPVPLSSYASDPNGPSLFRFVPVEPRLGQASPVQDLFERIRDEFSVAPLAFPDDELQFPPAPEPVAAPHFCFAPIPVIPRPIAAQMIDPSPFEPAISGPFPVHPDEVQFHLSAVASLLAELGLSNETKGIQEFQQQFQRDHYQRLLIAFKESQLQALQAEIASLKQIQQSSVADAHVALRLKIIELNQEGREKFAKFSDRPGVDRNHPVVRQLVEFESPKIDALIDDLVRCGDAKITAEPSATVLNGRHVRFMTGGEIAVPAVIDNGGHTINQVSFKAVGTTILAEPQLIDSSTIRLGLILEYPQSNSIESAKAAMSGAGRGRIETVIGIKSGRTVGLICPPASTQKGENDPEKVTSFLALVTPEVVQRSATTIGSPVPRPVPVQYNSRPRVVDVRVGGEK